MVLKQLYKDQCFQEDNHGFNFMLTVCHLTEIKAEK